MEPTHMASLLRGTKRRLARMMPVMVLVTMQLATHTGMGQPAAAAESSVEALQIYEGAANAQNQKAFDLAAEEWANFLKKFPNDPLAPKARYYEGVCYLQLKEWPKAIEAFRTVTRQYPKFELLEDAYLNLGWCLYSAAENGDRERYAEAVTAFTELLEKFPEGKHRDEALFFRGESLYAQDKKAEAVDSYRELINKHADSRLRCDGLYALGVALEETQQYQEAGEIYDSFLSGCATSDLVTEVRMRKAETLLQTGEIEAAEALFGEVAAVPDFAAADYALLRQAFARASLEQFEQAAELYLELAQRFPNSTYAAEAELAAGRALYRAGNRAAATEWLVAAQQRGGAIAFEAAHWLVRVKLAEDQVAEAERIAREQLAVEGDHPFRAELELDLADAYYEQPERRAESLAMFLNIADRQPPHPLAAQALYNAAFAALDLKDYLQAQSLARRFTQTYPDHRLVADAEFVDVEAALQQRDFAAARSKLVSLVERFPDRSDRDAWRVRIGLVDYLAGQYEAAIAHLRPLADELTDAALSAEALYLIGASHFYRNQYDDAAAALQQSLETNNKWRQADEAMLLLARCHQRQNRLEDAERLVRELIANFPQSTIADQAEYRLGEILYSAGKFQDALEAYSALVENRPTSLFAPFALYGVGWSQLKLAQYPAAAETFVALVNEHPMHELADDALLASGMARRQAGQHREAIEDLNKFLATNPKQPQKSDALYERALAEVAIEDFAAATATLRGALDENPTYAGADKMLYELAWAYRSAGETEKALAEFAKLAAEHPQSPLAAEAHFHVAERLYEQQKYAEAAEQYTKAKTAATLSELKEKASYKLGWSYFQAKQYDKSAEVFAEQTASFPDGILHGDAVFMHAESLFQNEQYPEALEAFARAQNVKPSSERMEALTLLHGGQSAAQTKQWEKAIELLAPIIERFPNSPYLAEAHYELGWARQNLGKLEEALKDYEVAAERRDAVGARARFMMGEVLFAQKKFDAAIRDFQRVMYLYGAENASPEIRKWQAKAAFEAGRCAEVQIQTADSTDKRTAALANAKKFYGYVVQEHADSEEAAEAKKRLSAIGTL